MKRAPSPLLLAAGAALCAVLGALFVVGFGGRPSRGADPPPAAGEIAPAPARQPRPAPSLDMRGMRGEIQRATARALEEVKRADLERYLDSLEQRARAQGRVTALELEPGMALIESMTDDPERAGRFASRMELLQRELSAAAGAGLQAAPAANPDELYRAIAAAAPERRSGAIVRYLEEVQALPDDEERDRRLRELERTHGAGAATPR